MPGSRSIETALGQPINPCQEAPHLSDDQSQADPANRGRDAMRPGDIPVPGWRDVLARVTRRIAADSLSIVAAGAAFFALIASFPALLVLLQVYGLVFDAGQIAEQLQFLRSQLEPEALSLVAYLMRGLGESDRTRLGFGIVGGALTTLWGASLGVRALMRSLNVAYGEREKRSFVVRHGLSLLLTTGAISVAFCMALVLLSVPLLTRWLALAGPLQRFVFYARWPTVALLFWLSLLVFYRYGPSRASARWSWVSWGALLATATWLAGTGVLAWYVAGSRRYHQAYGSVGVVVLVLAWFLVSAFSVLLGAELNAELERQTRQDTTVGDEKAAGARGATVADTLGEAST
jgi:membrane protein